MGFKYSTITDNYGTGTKIRSTSPRTYRGDSIQVTAQVGASAYTFTEGSEIYNSVHSQLQNASPGTNVLLWLGINDCSAVPSTYQFYARLAVKYSSLNFYAISITGVDEHKCYLISNWSVLNFNKKLADKINRSGISNLKFKSIVDGDNVNTLILGKTKVKMINYMTDGLHYTREGYFKLWPAMASQF